MLVANESQLNPDIFEELGDICLDRVSQVLVSRSSANERYVAADDRARLLTGLRRRVRSGKPLDRSLATPFKVSVGVGAGAFSSRIWVFCSLRR